MFFSVVAISKNLEQTKYPLKCLHRIKILKSILTLVDRIAFLLETIQQPEYEELFVVKESTFEQNLLK